MQNEIPEGVKQYIFLKKSDRPLGMVVSTALPEKLLRGVLRNA